MRYERTDAATRRDRRGYRGGVGTRHPVIIGHRGAPGYRPEHSRSSYELAFALGADAVEPDVVVSKDGVLVVRHENEISGTTDVADRPAFAGRRSTRRVDGVEHTGWFTEDFTWDELSTLRCRERLPALRPDSAAFDDTEPVLRLREVLDLARAAGRGVVLEVKHATHFREQGWDVAALVAHELADAGWADAGMPLVIESFEPTVLGELRARGIPATCILLLEAAGRPYDLVVAQGRRAPTYGSFVLPAGLDGLVGVVDGISVDRHMLLRRNTIVADAHARGLLVYTWTCRPENTFLLPRFRVGRDPAAFGDYASEWAMLRGVDGVFLDHPDLGVAAFAG